MSELVRLPRVVASEAERAPIHGARHAMRAVTEETVRDRSTWTRDRAAEVAAYFDVQARDWETRFAGEAGRFAPLEDALARGGPIARGRCVDLGCGTGAARPVLEHHFASVVGVDLSPEMLRRAPGRRVLADGAALPIATASQDAVVLVNAFLFADEVARVTAPDGVVVWVSLIGADTPIYLPPDAVRVALPGPWHGVWSEAGAGSWAVLRRDHS